MSNIERFNKLLNTTSYDRYNSWVDFRNEIDALLKSEINGLKSKRTMVVIGAGRCEDFSLKPLVEHFGTVILSDVDDKSIFKSMEYLRLTDEERSRVQVVKVEYTGVENNGFFDGLEDRLREARDFEAIDLLFKKGFEGLDDYRFLKEFSGEADLVYVSPIYTQLIYQQIMLVCSKLRSEGFQENLLKYVEHVSGERLIDVFTLFNQNVGRIVKERLVVASDIFQDYSDSTFMENAKKDFSDDNMEQIYKEYFESYGFGMGDLGLYLLNESMTLLKEKWLLWPFDERSEMVVKLSTYKK